jgi:hypothetical protein
MGGSEPARALWVMAALLNMNKLDFGRWKAPMMTDQLPIK